MDYVLVSSRSVVAESCFSASHVQVLTDTAKSAQAKREGSGCVFCPRGVARQSHFLWLMRNHISCLHMCPAGSPFTLP